MKSSLFRIFQYLILLSIGFALCWFFFRDFNVGELFKKIQAGNFSWFYPVMFVSTLVYIFRVLRWQMLIKAIGHNASFGNAFSALSIGYFVNFFFPRLGEITRCLTLKKQNPIPFMQLLGTVIIERIIDIVCLFIVVLLALILQFNQLIEFVQKNIFLPFYHGIILKIINGNGKIMVVVLSLVVILFFLLFFFRKYIREKSPKLILQFIKGLKEGLSSVAKLEQKKLFLLYTVLIWVCYYFMTFLWFFVLNETKVLSWGASLSILSIGTIGRSVPIAGGGMGAYHFLVTNVIQLYGVDENSGKMLAAIIHGGQTFLTFVLGLVGLLFFFTALKKPRIISGLK